VEPGDVSVKISEEEPALILENPINDFANSSEVAQLVSGLISQFGVLFPKAEEYRLEFAFVGDRGRLSLKFDIEIWCGALSH